MDKPYTFLASLTAKNPVPVYVERKKSYTSTKHRQYYEPRKMTKWGDFTYPNLLTLYGGTKIGELLEKPCSEKPRKPIDHDRNLHDEKSTRTLYDTWNRQVVSHALDSVKDELHPCRWECSSSILDPKILEALHHNTIRKITQKPKTRARNKQEIDDEKQETDEEKHVKYKRFPDNGSGLYCTKCVGQAKFERFPKDYKFSKVWTSTNLEGGRLIDADGNWKTEASESALAWAIRQIYTYCVDHLCRFGAILSSEEAFVLQIRPMGDKPEVEPGKLFPFTRNAVMVIRLISIFIGSAAELKELRRQLMTNGLIEYVSIRWADHWNPAIQREEKLTVNLAMWYMHILAGNGHRAYWSPEGLESERLSSCVLSPNSDEERRSSLARDPPNQNSNPQPSSSSKLPSQDRDANLSRVERRLLTDSNSQPMHEELSHDKAQPKSKYNLRPRSGASGEGDSNRTLSSESLRTNRRRRVNSSLRQNVHRSDSESSHIQQGPSTILKKRKHTLDDDDEPHREEASVKQRNKRNISPDDKYSLSFREEPLSFASIPTQSLEAWQEDAAENAL